MPFSERGRAGATREEGELQKSEHDWVAIGPATNGVIAGLRNVI